MTTKITTNANFTKAENDLFSWDYFSADFLTYKPTGQQVYQMQWYEWKNSQPITDQTIKDAVTDFWAQLQALQDAEQKSKVAVTMDSSKGKSGYCNKCHSYCYGDCQS